MRQKTILGLFALLVVGLVGAGLVSANATDEREYRQGYGMMGGYGYNMHDDMINVLENGSYSDLENMREEYNMPIMYWINSPEMFEEIQQEYQSGERIGRNRYGGCPMWG